MIIGEFLTIYERNHVAFLRNSLGTSRRLQKYVRRPGHLELADLKRLQVIEWFHDITKTDGPHGANLALQQLHRIRVEQDSFSDQRLRIQRALSLIEARCRRLLDLMGDGKGYQ